MSKSKGKPTNSKPRMKLVNDLIRRVETAIDACDEYALSHESPLAEFVSDFGYNEGELSFEYIEDETKETLEALVAANPKTWRKLVLEFCSVELHGIHFVEGGIFSASIGETEHQLDELDNEISKLSDGEQVLVRDKANIRAGGWVYTCHNYERFVLILDEEEFNKKYPPKSIKVYGPLKLVWSA